MRLNREQKTGLRQSIKHWELDIVQWLLGGYVLKKKENGIFWCDGTQLMVGTEECALCDLYYFPDVCDPCIGCPLADEQFCGDPQSAYKRFLQKPNLENATYMVNVMKEILHVSD